MDRGPVSAAAFAPLGPVCRWRTLATGRTVRYVDEGDPSWRAVLFLGGAGTSARALRLVEFARDLREELELRVLSVERNGFGLTPLRPGHTMDQHAADVWTLLDDFGIDRVAVVAISGGGPYAARILAAQPERVSSVHLACAFSEHRRGDPVLYDPASACADPVAWWTFPSDSAVHRVPGLAEAAAEEGVYSLRAQGAPAGLAALTAELRLTTEQPLPDLTRVAAPVDLYWGADDSVVPLEHLARWRSLLPATRNVRVYAGEGHDVQYRHWDQILCDIRHDGARVLISEGGRAVLVNPRDAEAALARGAHLGLPAWAP